MDFSQEFLIDLALNAGGYLLAGVLAVVIYSIFNRKKAARAVSVAPARQTQGDTEPQRTPAEIRRMEFVKLGERTDQTAEKTEPARAETTGRTGERRNRAEMMKIARSMLKAGASHDRIRTVLPVSEAELSLLDMSRS